jgi:branched-chain amino acid transport system ATP-binding protein
MTLLLRTSGLCAGYNGLSVVRDVDIEISEGEVVALVGPNGAGKTTTLLTLSGLLEPIGGEIEVLGAGLEPPKSAHRLVHRGLAHVPEDRSLFKNLTVEQHLNLRKHSQHSRDLVSELFPKLDVLKERRVGLLSGGEQQMVAIARALMGAPRILLIDEMSMGLAPLIVRSLLDTIRRLADVEGTAVLLVEQHVRLALGVADRGYVMSGGRIVMSGTSTELLADVDRIESSYLGVVKA